MNSAEGVDLDAELNIHVPVDAPKDSSDVTLQVQIQNNDDSSARRKISTEVIGADPPAAYSDTPTPDQTESGEKPEPKQVTPPKPSVLKSADLTHRDPGKHWCSVTSKWLNSIHDLLMHLHSDEYQLKLANKEKPWKKRLDVFHTKLKGNDNNCNLTNVRQRILAEELDLNES